jgi:hypothetical protein
MKTIVTVLTILISSLISCRPQSDNEKIRETSESVLKAIQQVSLMNLKNLLV